MSRFTLILWLLLATTLTAWAGAPTAPFTPDANTLLLMHFDGNLNDASATNASSAFSAIGGSTNPAYAAAQSGFGQALDANGGTINGVVVNAPALSQTTAPLTVECWMKFPSARQADDYNNTVLDLAAGRFLFRIRHEANGAYVYPMLNTYDQSVNPQYNFAAVSTAAGFSEDTWHHYAVVLDPTAANGATFYFDGVKLATLGQTSPPAVTSDFSKLSYPAATGGRVWPPAAPTQNLEPLIGAIDELRLSKGVRYGTAAVSNTLLDLRFNGNLLDSSIYGRNGTLSNIATYSNPTYTAARDTTAAQALTGTGGNINGVYLSDTSLSMTTGPLTVEGWLYFPASQTAADYTNTILNLGAGRFHFKVRHEAGGNYLYPELTIYNLSVQPEQNYAAVPRALGWNEDEWHKFAVTYNPGGSPAVVFFFDNQKLSLLNNGVQPAVTSNFDKAAERPLIAGVVWPPAAPTQNLMPLVGSIDDVKVTKGILYGNAGSDPTVFHYKLDGNLLDSGPNAYNGVMTSIGGYNTPSYVAGHDGQALSGNGGDLNGVLVPNTLASMTSSPLTAEAWIYVPASEIGQEFNINIADLSAGRFLFYVRHAGTPDTNIYTTLSIYTNDVPTKNQQNYALVSPADGWTHDAWHHVAVTYDPSRVTPVEFFFDEHRMSLYTPGGVDPITSEFQKVAEPALVAGRVWPPSSPALNLMPLRGRVDDIKVTRAIVYTVTDQAPKMYADPAEGITVDGNASDWASVNSSEVLLDTGGRGSMTARVKYAWDASYFYFLIREGGTAGAAQEAANQAAYAAAPYNFDTVAFWMDLDNSNEGEQVAQDVCPWFGFSSTARTDLYTGRINNAAAFNSAPFISATVRTSGTFAAHNRVIEAALKWSDLALVVDGPRQPNGNLMTSIYPGYSFGVEPMLMENDYNKQSFIGGAQYTVPNGIDANSRDVMLRGTNAARNWDLYQ